MRITSKTAMLVLLMLLYISCHPNNREVVSDTSHVITNQISNQQISSFTEDAFGQVWIGTFRGLNKYNAHEYHQYFNSDDSLSLCDSQVKQVFCDSKNRIWVGTVNGICQYTDQDCFRKIPNESVNPYVNQIFESRDGRIFLNMAIDICEYIPDEDKFKVVISNSKKVDENIASKCFIDSSNNLWLVYPFQVRCFDLKTFQLKQTFDTKAWYIHYAFMRDNDQLWLASLNTLNILDIHTGQFIDKPEVIRKHSKLSEAVIEYIHPYNNASLLINTSEGLYLYNFMDNTILFQGENGFPFEPPEYKITTMFTDSQKNLWLGSFDQGFTIRYNYKERFNTNNYLRLFFNHKSVIDLKADKNDNLWITTSMNGVYVYNQKTEVVQPVETQHLLPEIKYFSNQVRSLFIDDDNFVWLLAQTKLIRCRYDQKRNILHETEVYWLPAPIPELVQDRNGTIWAGCYNRYIYALRKGSKEFEEIVLYPESYTFTTSVKVLSSGKIMVVSLNHNPRIIDPDSWESEELEVYSQIKRSTFIPTCQFEDSQGDIWIGTITNGLLRYSSRTKQTERMEGTTCTDISAIQEDRQGNIWISTLYGLSKFDRTVNKFTNYYISDGIGGNQFNERSSCRLEDGTLIFGGTHGLTFFDPIDIMFKRNIPLVFEDLKIHNQLIRPFRSKCIDRHLTYNPTINLQHDQNSFTISFAALDYSEYERVHYHYMMEGFDNFWIDARNNREAYYSNLPAGKYTFKIRITNNDKSIVEAENSIPVIVKPAPWATWWAYTIYILLIALLSFVIIRLFTRIRQNKLRIAQAEQEKEQEQRLNKMNMSFFSNISHEFRTPLTMISGPVTQLCGDPSIPEEPKQLLHIVQRSVNRMLKLVNQLMDFNKLENDVLKLKVKRTDIISELNRLMEVFALNANSKGITFKAYGLEDSFLTWLDIDKMEKITGNLISNALKFTPSGGKIELRFDVISREKAANLFALTDKDISREYIKISVSDSGPGIPEEKREKVFERYYQLYEQSKGMYNWGTGIGLYYCRRMTDLHHGYIKAIDNPEGQGIRLVFILPTDDNAYTSEEKVNSKEIQEVAFPLQTEEQYRIPEKGITKEKKPTILVVDDDTEVVHYLKSLLSKHYQVICRFDAESAYKTLKEEETDLVLSDVLMPGTTGFDLCRMIKEDLQLCHIPVILITAKATVEDQVTGLDTGADAYVTKPFNPNYLLALIKSQLSNREKIRNLLGTATKTDKIVENVLSPQDNTFMTRLYELMENELSNSELNITRMTEVMRISRTKFYYKVKGLTGENPNVFFKTYKLNRAAELLEEGKYNVSEVADMTGFNTLSHFSSSFKKQFGIIPSEYRN